MTTTTPRRTDEATKRGGKGFRPLWTTLAILAVVAIVTFGLVLLVGGGTESDAELEAAALEELVAQERAVLDPYYGQADPTGYAGMFAADMTYFDPWSGGKLEDNVAKQYLLGFAGTFPAMHYEIFNESVDLYEDTAIFTFNVEVTSLEDGALLDRWNATEVHRRTGDGWEAVHVQWGPWTNEWVPAE